MDDKNSNQINELSINQYLTYVGPLLIFLGMTRLITFYNSFGVSITSYLDFSEVLTSFFDILIIVVIFLAYTSIQNYLASGKSDTEKANKKRLAILEEESFFKIFKRYLNYFSSFITFGLIVILGCFIASFGFNWITTYTVFIFTSIFVFLLIFFYCSC